MSCSSNSVIRGTIARDIEWCLEVIEDKLGCTLLYSFQSNNLFNEVRSPDLGSIGKLRADES